MALWSWFITPISHYHYFSGTVVLLHRIHFTLPLLHWLCGPDSSHPFHTTITSVVLWSWFITSISPYHFHLGVSWNNVQQVWEFVSLKCWHTVFYVLWSVDHLNWSLIKACCHCWWKLPSPKSQQVIVTNFMSFSVLLQSLVYISQDIYRHWESMKLWTVI